MDEFLLARLARELDEEWRGAWVQQAWQDVEGRVVLQLHRGGDRAATRFLLLSTLPEAQGFGLLSARPSCPVRPPAFASYLRAHLCGGCLDSARCHPFDRVVELFFRGREGPFRLVLEATGRRANLLALDPGGAVRAALRWEPAESHPLRPVEPGRAYAPPPPRRPGPIPPADGAALSETPDADPKGTLEGAGRWLEQAAEDRSARADGLATEARAKAAKKKLSGRLEKIGADLARLPDPSALRRQGNALAAGLGAVRRGDAEARVTDLEDPEREWLIPLDPGLTPGQNLNRVYERARKSERARAALERRIRETKAELAALDVSPVEPAPRSGPGEKPGQAYRRLRASNGWPIWVGRNGRENDRLVKEARPWDLWLHVRDAPGAHVVIRLPGRESKVPEAVVLEAATLAARSSRVSDDGAVDVMVVEAGRVRKPKGASPGRVVVAGERTVRVRLA